MGFYYGFDLFIYKKIQLLYRYNIIRNTFARLGNYGRKYQNKH
jgi:hypothetical protein